MRSQSLPPNAFLTQYLGSHDLWKGDVQELIEITIQQERPIRPDPFKTGIKDFDDNIDLGSSFATKLGFAGITKWDGTAIKDHQEQQQEQEKSIDLSSTGQGGGGGGKKKKKNNNKKKKKKK